MLVQRIGLSGAAPTFAAPSASDTVPVGSTLIVKNASAGAVTVTLVTPGTLATGDAYPDKSYTVAAGAEAWIPVLIEYRPSSDSSGAPVTFSATASVTAAAVVPQS